MSDFIRVLADDAYYKGLKTYMYVDSGLIHKVVPIHAVEEKGKLFRCTQDHAGAKIVSFILVDANGVEYSCGNRQELEKLGIIEPEKSQSRFGFVANEKAGETAVDLG